MQEGWQCPWLILTQLPAIQSPPPPQIDDLNLCPDAVGCPLGGTEPPPWPVFPLHARPLQSLSSQSDSRKLSVKPQLPVDSEWNPSTSQHLQVLSLPWPRPCPLLPCLRPSPAGLLDTLGTFLPRDLITCHPAASNPALGLPLEPVELLFYPQLLPLLFSVPLLFSPPLHRQMHPEWCLEVLGVGWMAMNGWVNTGDSGSILDPPPPSVFGSLLSLAKSLPGSVSSWLWNMTRTQQTE